MMTEHVSDPVDRAAQLEEEERAACARYRKPETPRTGKCAACGETLPLQGIVCDSECRETYERILRAAHRNGRPR